MTVTLQGIGTHYARMEGYDSTLLAWIPSPPFSGTGGGGSTQVSVSSLAGVVVTSGNSTVTQGTNPWTIAGNSTVFPGAGSTWAVNISMAGGSTVASALSSASIGTEAAQVVRPVITARAGLSTLAALNHEVALVTDGYLGASYNISSGGNLVGTISFEQSFDGGVTYAASIVISGNTLGKIISIANPAGGAPTAFFAVIPNGITKVRARVSNYVSGSCVIRCVGNTVMDPFGLALTAIGEGQLDLLNMSVVVGGRDASALARGHQLRPSTPASTTYGLAVRPCVYDSTTVSGAIAATSTGDVTLITSAATAIYVYAYNFATASSGQATLRLLNGSTSEVWRTLMDGDVALSGAPDRDVLAVSPPAFLFRTASGNPLVANKGTSSLNAITYSLAFWRE